MLLTIGKTVPFAREEREAHEAEDSRLKAADSNYISLREAVTLPPRERRRQESRLRACFARWPEGELMAILAFMGAWDPNEEVVVER